VRQQVQQFGVGCRRSPASTGAEKPRSSEGTGSASTKMKVCVAWSSAPARARCRSAVRSSAFELQRQGAPIGADQAHATGITNGSLCGWPGVAGQLLRQGQRVGAAAAS
jgi:hypothetical protein